MPEIPPALLHQPPPLPIGTSCTEVAKARSHDDTMDAAQQNENRNNVPPSVLFRELQSHQRIKKLIELAKNAKLELLEVKSKLQAETKAKAEALGNFSKLKDENSSLKLKNKHLEMKSAYHLKNQDRAIQERDTAVEECQMLRLECEDKRHPNQEIV